MITSRQNVAETRKIPDLFQRLSCVGKFEQVPVGVGHHHVFGLPANPAAEIDVAVGAAGPARIDIEADVGVALLAVAAASARHVEGHRDQVTFLDTLDVVSTLDYLAGNLMTQDHSRRCRRPAAHHVLVAAANIRRDRLENDPMLNLSSLRRLQLRISNTLHFNLAWPGVDHSTICCHVVTLHN